MQSYSKTWVLLFGVSLLAFQTGCANLGGIRPPKDTPPETVSMLTTGYCPCGSCCGWGRNWLGRAVYKHGANKGQPKKVGVTASGSKVHKGTIAADTRTYPMGTVMRVPGYGYGRVEDRGGAIKGEHIDLYFPSHQKALEWGRRELPVQVWRR